MELTKEQYVELRKSGKTKEEILDLAQRGKISESLVPKETFKQKGLLRTIGGVLGMEEFGRGIGTALSNAAGTQDKVIESLNQSSLIQSNLLKKIKENKEKGIDTTRLEKALAQLTTDIKTTSEQVTNIGTSGLSNREVLGSALQTGLSVVGLRGGLPTAQGIATKTGLGKVASNVVSGAASGAAFGGAEAITEGENVVGGAIKGAAFGGSTGLVFGAVSKYIDDLSTQTPKERLGELASELKTVRRSFEKNSLYKNVNGKREIISDPITTLTELKIIPKVIDGKVNAGDAREQVRSLISELDDEATAYIDDAVKNGEFIKLADFKQATEEAIRKSETLQEKGIVGKTLKQAETIFNDYAESYGDDLSVATINKIKIAQNKLWNPDEVDTARAIGDSARKVLYERVPAAQDIFRREGRLIAADKFLDVLDGKAVSGGRLGKYFYDLIGAMAGSTTQIPVIGPVAGALGARQVTDFVQKQSLDPVMGKAARTLLESIDKLPTDAAGNISKTALMNLIGQLSNQ